MANTPIPAVISPVPQATDLQVLAKDINQCLADLATAHKHSLACALKLGSLLNDAKTSVGHGNWTQWLAVNCKHLSERTAQRYMSVAGGRPKIEDYMKSKSANLADLTIQQAERLITKPKAIAANAKTDVVSEPAVGATNDPLLAVTVVGEKFITALSNLRRNDEKKAREAATAIIKRLKELHFT